MSKDMLQTALSYFHDLGWSVMPVGQDKKPLLNTWKPLQDDQPAEEQIQAWWGKWPDANIGVITGPASGLVVIDIDSEEGYEEIKPTLTPTLTARTGGGGLHKYYRYPDGVDRVKNAVRVVTGVDVRADGGYVVAPPSEHESGNEYTWENSESINALPDELLDELAEDRRKGPMTGKDWEVDVEEGHRDDELTRRAGKLMASDIPPAEVYTMLRGWNEAHCTPPLPNRELKKIVKSIERRQDGKEAGSNGHKSEDDEHEFRVQEWNETYKNYGLQRTTWLVEDWLPSEALGMVWAPPGSYKTWMLLDLALAVSTGRQFLGHYPVTDTGPVLILQQEDPFPMLFSRLGTIANVGRPEFHGEHFRINLPERPAIYWHPDRELHFDRPDSVDGLERAIRDIEPKLVIIDPLYSAAKTDDYMAETATQMLPLKKMKDDVGCSFMIAHHSRKSGGEGRKDLWGSQFLNALLETGWQIELARASNTISITRHFKQAEEPEMIDLTFNIDDYNYETEIRTGASDEDRVRQIVENQDVSSVKEVAEELGHSGKGTASQCLKELGARKQNGVYTLPEED